MASNSAALALQETFSPNTIYNSNRVLLRDTQALMGYPIFAFSKNRRDQIVYEKVGKDGYFQSIVSTKSDHYIASIYDWDIIMVLAGIYQEKINAGYPVDRRIRIERADILKRMSLSNRSSAHHRLKGALNRLESTSVKITSAEEKIDSRIIDSWIFTDRKDIVEIEIVLSHWIFQHICKNGNLLKIDPEYFELTSGIERFLYRIARKYLGRQNKTLLLIETLYKKSGSEDSISLFKRDLKKKVKDNNIPLYDMEWIEINDKAYVSFSKSKRTKWEPRKKDRTERRQLTVKNVEVISPELPLQTILTDKCQPLVIVNQMLEYQSSIMLNESEQLDETLKNMANDLNMFDQAQKTTEENSQQSFLENRQKTSLDSLSEAILTCENQPIETVNEEMLEYPVSMSAMNENHVLDETHTETTKDLYSSEKVQKIISGFSKEEPLKNREVTSLELPSQTNLSCTWSASELSDMYMNNGGVFGEISKEEKKDFHLYKKMEKKKELEMYRKPEEEIFPKHLNKFRKKKLEFSDAGIHSGELIHTSYHKGLRMQTYELLEDVCGVDISRVMDTYCEDLNRKFFKDLKIFMRYPFVSLSPKTNVSITTYRSKDERKYIHLTPTNGHNVSSIYDWDLMIFSMSVYLSLVKEKEKTDTIMFRRNKLIKFIHKHEGAKTALEIEAALNRLQHTKIKTNVLGKKHADSEFSFIDNWHQSKEKDGLYITIKFSECILELMNKRDSMVSIEPAYFRLLSSTERFLSRMAKVVLGNRKDRAFLDLSEIHSLSGSQKKYSQFAFDLKRKLKELSLKVGFTHVLNHRIDLVINDDKESLMFLHLFSDLRERKNPRIKWHRPEKSALPENMRFKNWSKRLQ